MNYYVVRYSNQLPKPQPSYINKVDQVPPEVVNKLIYMYRGKNLTLMEIADKMGMKWWTVKEVFKKYGIKRMSLSERAKIKRAKDFNLIYRLHFIEKIAIKEIYRTYGFSPPYIRSVLKDQGLKPINRGQFGKRKTGAQT